MAFEAAHAHTMDGKISAWQKKTEEHKEKQLINPFSKWSGASHRQKLQRDDPNYGTPVEGSKTDMRGKQAGTRISNEIVDLCRYIYELGEHTPDGVVYIHFGKLFEAYTKISNKLVGMLMRARRHGLVEFEGEMLFQRRDDHVEIYLVQIPSQLEEFIAAKEAQKLAQ